MEVEGEEGKSKVGRDRERVGGEGGAARAIARREDGRATGCHNSPLHQAQSRNRSTTSETHPQLHTRPRRLAIKKMGQR